MNIIALDTETPKFDDKEPWKGNVYGDPRPPVCWSAATHIPDDPHGWAVKWDASSVSDIQTLLDNCDLCVMFNGKHDVAYLRREGVNFSNVKVWDVQLAEFVIGRQLHKFPSLNDTCIRYDVPVKLDVVKTDYWDKGIDTEDIPWDVLSEYAAHDADVTLRCYHAQLKLLTPAQRTLVSLMSQDMLILQEMEANGIAFDEQMCAEMCVKNDDEISKITAKLQAIYPNVPISFSSNDNLSAFLYGGTVFEDSKEHIGFFKTGAKTGQPKYKNIVVEHKLPRLFTPLKGTELKKEGFYETNEPTLAKLKGPHKSIVTDLLRLAKLQKLNGTYYKGLPKLREKMHWEPGKLHGQLHQTLAQTGRLSSSKPNQQNFASELQNIFVSEYD